MPGVSHFVAIYQEMQTVRACNMGPDAGERLARYERECMERMDRLQRRIDRETDPVKQQKREHELEDITQLLAFVRLKAWQYCFPQQSVPQQMVADVYPGFIRRFDGRHD